MEEDLNVMLLKAAGRTEKDLHSSPASRRRHAGSYSDDGSDSRDDDSDDGRRYGGRKPNVSQVPLKKRVDPEERDDEHSSSREEDEDDDDEDDGDDDREGDSDNDSVGSDLYKGDKDRKRLEKMSELDREMILSDRADKRTDKGLKNNIKKQKEKSIQSTRKVNSPPPQSVVRSSARSAIRSSARSADRASGKSDALTKLRDRKRAREQDPEPHKKRRDADSAVKRRGFTELTPSRSEDEDEDEDEEDSADEKGDGDNDKISKDSTILTYEDVKGITIRRSKLAKWFMEPFFEDLIVGCFVRVGIGKSRSGPIYRLCMVRNVDAADPDRQYKLENKMTHKYLNCVWGNETTAARWQMAMISDSPPIKEEFDQLLREVDRHGGRMPSKQEVLEKREAIDKTNTFVYSAETVKQMLQEKKSTIRRPLNVAAEKDRLREDMEVAKMKHDDVEVERIKAKLQELEDSRHTQKKDDKAIKLAEMNRKNRFENFKNASEVKPLNTGLKAGEAGYDPFSRRWTRSRNYYVSKPGEAQAAEAQAQAAEAHPEGGKAGLVATVAALEAAADAGKLVDTSAPVDHGTESTMLHDFDLPISLAALQKFGGPHGVQAGFMARKQRIEATVGVKVPENDGRRHALTLSVSDYKRRRGLL
ncbi:protein RTF1 homolog [Rutidosis leptorrhynchoides]|uniref:protein RTF1 homolog n=1 Tax=Rutidosis leptorrhynchoides TaxID=125765 RepID=UPI003A99E66B